MKGKYKRTKFYCSCDKNIVGRGIKCKICGARIGVKLKKPSKAAIIKLLI